MGVVAGFGRRCPGRLHAATEWGGVVGTLPAGRRPPSGDRPPGRCTAWERAGLDPGWAGAAGRVVPRGTRPSGLRHLPRRPRPPPLIEDVVALLPAEKRWAVSFGTCLTGLPPHVASDWRFVAAGSPEAHQAASLPHALVIDLTASVAPTDSLLVTYARTGKGSPVHAGPKSVALSAPNKPSRTCPARLPDGKSPRRLGPPHLGSRPPTATTPQPLLGVGPDRLCGLAAAAFGMAIVWFAGAGDESVRIALREATERYERGAAGGPCRVADTA